MTLSPRAIHVSLDNWRGKSNVRGKEQQAIAEGLEAVAAGRADCLVVDNTNATALTRQRYFEYAREAAGRLARPVRLVAYWFDESLAACLDRNAARPVTPPPGASYFVPPAAIVACQNRLEPPGYAEGFEAIYRVTITGPDTFHVELLARPTGSQPPLAAGP